MAQVKSECEMNKNTIEKIVGYFVAQLVSVTCKYLPIGAETTQSYADK